MAGLMVSRKGIAIKSDILAPKTLKCESLEPRTYTSASFLNPESLGPKAADLIRKLRMLNSEAGLLMLRGGRELSDWPRTCCTA